MRTEQLIADFPTKFSTTFQHAARERWGVDFDTSDVDTILTKLHQLKHVMQHGTPRPSNAYRINFKDVERAEAMLTELLQRWKEHTHLPPPSKHYDLLEQLRELATPTAAEQIRELITPKPSAHLNKKEQKQGKIDAKKRERVINLIRKENKKR